MALTFHQRRRLREGRKWLGDGRKSILDHVSPEAWAMLSGIVFSVLLTLAVWGMVFA